MQEVAISIPESGHAADVEPTPDAISVDIAEESPGHKGHEGGHAADVEPTRACKSGHAADVAIVGGGWTAIIAARKCQKEGLSVVLLEARDAFGGLWAYSSEAGVPSVFADTITTSSKTVTESVEYPMPADYPEFVPHAQVKQYIDSFVDHFGLRSSIRLNCRVTSVDKIGELDGWRVAYQRAGCAEGESLTAAKLIIATGVHQKASFPDSLMRGPLAGFPREQVIHSSELKTTTPPELAGKRVLVIGGGETSSDLCEGISRIAKAVTWSIPNGVWMISRFTPNFFSISIAPWLGRLFSAKAAFDGYANPMTTVATVTRFFYNGERGARFSPEALKTNATQVAFGFGACGHGVKEWLHPAEYSTSFINKNRDVIEAVHDGIITPRRGLTGGEGQKVTFDDGSSETFDVVVLSTGFSTSLPFLRGTAYAEKLDQRSLYMMCISHEDPSLAFIGFSRPMIGSIPMVAAAQGALIAKTFSGATPLPDKEARAAAIAKVRSHHEAFFSSTSERLTGLISWKYLMHFLYDAIGGKASWRQCAVAVARRPLLFFVAAFSSQGAGILRLAAKGQLDERAWQIYRRGARGGLLSSLAVMMLQIWWVPLTGIIWLLGLVGLPKSRVTLALFGRGIASYDREVDIYLSEKLPRPLYWVVRLPYYAGDATRSLAPPNYAPSRVPVVPTFGRFARSLCMQIWLRYGVVLGLTAAWIALVWGVAFALRSWPLSGAWLVFGPMLLFYSYGVLLPGKQGWGYE